MKREGAAVAEERDRATALHYSTRGELEETKKKLQMVALACVLLRLLVWVVCLVPEASLELFSAVPV